MTQLARRKSTPSCLRKSLGRAARRLHSQTTKTSASEWEGSILIVLYLHLDPQNTLSNTCSLKWEQPALSTETKGSSSKANTQTKLLFKLRPFPTKTNRKSVEKVHCRIRHLQNMQIRRHELYKGKQINLCPMWIVWIDENCFCYQDRFPCSDYETSW